MYAIKCFGLIGVYSSLFLLNMPNSSKRQKQEKSLNKMLTKKRKNKNFTGRICKSRDLQRTHSKTA